MTFEEALKAELENIKDLNSKVSPLNMTEGAEEPYLVYVSSDGKEDRSLDGFLRSKNLFCELNILAARYKDMKSLAKQVRGTVKSFPGRIIAEKGPLVQEVIFEDDSPELYEDQVGLYRKIISFRAYFEDEEE